MLPGTAFVTGATEGIGRATALALGRAGYRVGVCARSAPKLELLLTELMSEGIRAAGMPADVGCEGQVRAAVAHVAQSLGAVDVAINNAGIGIFKPFDELTTEDWDATMATNLRSLFLVCREVLPGMRQRRRGAIVNIASLAGRNGFVGGTAYAASKHAVLGFSRSLMLEVRREGVRVIAVCPGSVDTPLLRQQELLTYDAERILQPEDVAAVVVNALSLPPRAMMSEIDLRPSNP